MFVIEDPELPGPKNVTFPSLNMHSGFIHNINVNDGVRSRGHYQGEDGVELLHLGVRRHGPCQAVREEVPGASQL
jgi:hypothetical protein